MKLSAPSLPTTLSAWPPEGYHLEATPCPNAGNLCNCPGTCRPRVVKDVEVKPGRHRKS